MFKRTWIVLLAVLVLGLLVSACGGGDLAEDLTPIPTLPPGEEPELVAALQATEEVAVTSGETDGEDMSQDELVSLGEQLFRQECESCHGAQPGAGPAFTGMAERAATRVEGMSAEEYLHESIVEPGAYIVEGYSNIMPADYGERFSEQEVQALVVYTMAESDTGEGAADGDAEAEATEEPTEEPTAAADDEAEEATEEPTEQPAEEPTEVPEEEATETPEADDGEADEGEDGDAASTAAAGDPAAGEELFGPNCASCHGAEPGVGPALTGMGESAAERVEDMNAVEYLHESIVDPGAYVVEGYQNIMPPNYEDQFNEQQIQDLIAYMLEQ